MTDIQIIQSPATVTNGEVSPETWKDYKARYYKATLQSIKYGDGTPIEVEQGRTSVECEINLPRPLTPEEFYALVGVLQGFVNTLDLGEGATVSIGTPSQYTAPVLTDDPDTVFRCVGQFGYMPHNPAKEPVNVLTNLLKK
ncbi:MAG: hypothetical protein LBT89_02100 [Planctomycetaceae bacterium]|jgi:hypothetical protein|nr:hypothetical protein [Planctomycetaceae bacterium]